MKYFALEVLGEMDEDYCFTNNSPSQIGDYELMVGESLKNEYPEDPFEITLELDEDSPGLITTSFLGNTKSILIMKKEVAEVILKIQKSKIDVYPFTLLNHKKRPHSKDYVFVNPLGSYDCFNMDLSEVDIDEDDGEILSIKKIVLDKDKLKEVPDLFRPKEDDSLYFFSEKLVTSIRKEGFTNFVFDELEIG